MKTSFRFLKCSATNETLRQMDVIKVIILVNKTIMENVVLKENKLLTGTWLSSELSDYLILRSLLGLVSALLSTSSL